MDSQALPTWPGNSNLVAAGRDLVWFWLLWFVDLFSSPPLLILSSLLLIPHLFSLLDFEERVLGLHTCDCHLLA